jgi:glycerate 2-kinase
VRAAEPGDGIRNGVTDNQTILRNLFQVALAAALPDGKFAGRLPEPPRGRTIVIGAGKASARMATAFEAAWPYPCSGLVITRYGHGAPTRSIEVVEAAHPVPDAAGEKAAERILLLARTAGPDDLVVCLMSGGASALLSLPAPGVSLADKQAINRALLKSGAPIHEMNIVRKSLSAIKGGRLAAAAAPARLVTYLISDVPGDDPAAIGSGPTIPEASDPERALAILHRYAIAVEPRIDAAIRANVAPVAPSGIVHMLATPRMALEAAAREAERTGIMPTILGDAIEGEAQDVARDMAGLVDGPGPRLRVLISGGETTVTVRGTGRGGRNAEFLLALMMALGHRDGISAIACDTDGIDGVEDNAGAWFGPGDLARAENLGLSPAAHLANNDAYSFFQKLNRLVVTGPTLTNVNDFRAILVA